MDQFCESMLLSIVRSDMAGVAKWLRQRFVVPPFVGSSPIVRP